MTKEQEILARILRQARKMQIRDKHDLLDWIIYEYAKTISFIDPDFKLNRFTREAT